MSSVFSVQQKAMAYNEIIRFTEESIGEYMSHRPAMEEMADWSKDELRSFYLNLVDKIESLQYAVEQTIEGAQNR